MEKSDHVEIIELLTNKLMSDRYPVLHIHDISTYIGATVFSKIDLVRAYYHIHVAPEGIPKIAVITPFILFRILRMPIGLTNAAQTFQQFIDQVFIGLTGVYAYINDILVASTTMKEHLQHL